MNVAGVSANCTQCPAGTYAPAGTALIEAHCVPCPPGTWTTAGSTDPIDCTNNSGRKYSFNLFLNDCLS